MYAIRNTEQVAFTCLSNIGDRHYGGIPSYFCPQDIYNPDRKRTIHDHFFLLIPGRKRQRHKRMHTCTHTPWHCCTVYGASHGFHVWYSHVVPGIEHRSSHLVKYVFYQVSHLLAQNLCIFLLYEWYLVISAQDVQRREDRNCFLIEWYFLERAGRRLELSTLGFCGNTDLALDKVL